jgi:hypothetical protein
MHIIKRRKGKWFGHISHRNCLLNHVVEGKIEGGIEVPGKRERRRNLLLGDLQKREDTEYCKGK